MRVFFTKDFWSRTSVQLITIGLFVIASRIPFLSAGYGMDSDAWRLAAASRHIALTGEYWFGRSPGHPLHEYVCALLWKGGPIALNGATAVMSVIAVLFFLLTLKKLNSKYIYLPSLAFAFTPVIFINSTTSMDHMWALGFIMGSFYYAITKKPFIAAILLGLAIASRVNSALMIIPLIILLKRDETNKNIFILFMIAFVLGFLFYVPGILKYGNSVIRDVIVAYSELSYIVFRLTAAVWGLIGTAAILFATLYQFFRKKKNKSSLKHSLSLDNRIKLALTAAIGLTLVLFFVFPYKAIYLILIVPFILILLADYLNLKLFRFVCICLIISPFVLNVHRLNLDFIPDYTSYSISFKGGDSDILIDFVKGPVISNNSIRLKQVDYANSVINAASQIKNKSVIVTDEFYPLFETILPYNFQGNFCYEYLLDSTMIRQYSAEGYEIYYLPNVDKANIALYGVNLNDFGGKPFIVK